MSSNILEVRTGPLEKHILKILKFKKHILFVESVLYWLNKKKPIKFVFLKTYDEDMSSLTMGQREKNQ